MHTQRIKCSIYLLSIAALCCFFSCASGAHRQSYFPIRVLEGTVQMHIALLPIKSYSNPGRGHNDYEAALRSYQKHFIPDSIPIQERNNASPLFFCDPRSDGEAKKNEAEYFIKELTQGNELRWHIPRDFKIKVTINNPYREAALCECSNRVFQLKKNEKKVLYFYN